MQDGMPASRRCDANGAAMLKRKMSETLMKWKGAPKRKVLLLLGARKTGKTFTVRRFAREQYRSFIEVNFLDSEEDGAFLAGAQSEMCIRDSAWGGFVRRMGMRLLVVLEVAVLLDAVVVMVYTCLLYTSRCV